MSKEVWSGVKIAVGGNEYARLREKADSERFHGVLLSEMTTDDLLVAVMFLDMALVRAQTGFQDHVKQTTKMAVESDDAERNSREFLKGVIDNHDLRTSFDRMVEARALLDLAQQSLFKWETERDRVLEYLNGDDPERPMVK